MEIALHGVSNLIERNRNGMLFLTCCSLEVCTVLARSVISLYMLYAELEIAI